MQQRNAIKTQVDPETTYYVRAYVEGSKDARERLAADDQAIERETIRRRREGLGYACLLVGLLTACGCWERSYTFWGGAAAGIAACLGAAGLAACLYWSADLED